MTIIGEAEIAVTANARQFASDVESQVGSVAKKAGVLLASAFAVDKVFDFAQASVSAASDLAESTSKVGVVFGQARQEIIQFGDSAATSVGLAKQEALEAAGTFGNLFTALGLSKEAAADMAPEVVQLGADLASFNNLGVPETLEKIRSGLVGEIEPLRSLGISFNAAQVEAKALELNLASATGEISESAKVQARLALIMEQTTAAQGDFARTSGGLANQQRILSAEWKNAQAAIGEALLPVVLELVQVGRQDLIPFIERAAKSSVPLFTSAIRAGVPIAESLMTVFDAGLPLLEGFARVVESTPTPVLTLVASIASMRSALGPIPKLLENISGPQGLKGLVSPMGAATVGAGLLINAVAAHNAERALERQRIEAVSDALDDNTRSMDENLASIVRSEFEGFADDLSKVGVTFETVQRAVLANDGSFDQLAQRVQAASDSVEGMSGSAVKLADDLQTARDVVLEGIQANLQGKVVNEELAQSLVDQALAANTAADGTVNLVGALAAANEMQRAAERETLRYVNAADAARGSTDVLGEAFQTAQDEADSFKSAIEEMLAPLLDQENASIRATQAVSDFAKELKAGREENELQEDFLLRIAASTNDLIEAQLGAATSSRDAADRLIELGRRFPEVKGKVDELVARMQFAGQEVGPAGRMIAQAFVDGIVNGLRDGQGRVTQSADTVARIIENTVSRRLEIQSPSKVAYRIAQDFIRGLAQGLRGADIVEAALDRLGDAFGGFRNAVEGLPNFRDVLDDITPETTLQEFLLGAQETQNNSAAFFSNIDRLVAAGADDLAAAFLERGIDAAGLAQQAVDAIATGELSAFEGWFERLESQTVDMSKSAAQILVQQFDESGRQGGLALGRGIIAGIEELEQAVVESAYRAAAAASGAIAAAARAPAARPIAASQRPGTSDIFAIPERSFPIPTAQDVFAIPEMKIVLVTEDDRGTQKVIASGSTKDLSGRQIRAVVQRA